MIKKSIILTISLIILLYSSTVFAKNNKDITPVYFYENVSKQELFDKIDEYIQKKKYKITSYDHELCFMYIKNKDISINIKQFGNDAYLIIIPPANKKGKLEDIDAFTEKITKLLKNVSQNYYPIVDECFYNQLNKDAQKIKNTRQTSIPDDKYNYTPNNYSFSVKRYVGYEKYNLSKYDKIKRKAKNKIDKKYYKEKEKAQKLLEKNNKKLKKLEKKSKKKENNDV